MSTHLLLAMKRWLHVAYITLFFLLFLSVADQALGHYNLLPINPTVLCLLALFPYVLHSLHHKRAWLALFPSNLPPLLPLVAMAGLALGFSFHPGAFWAEGGKWIFLIPYGLLVILLASVLGYRYLSTSVLTFASVISLSLILSSIIADYVAPGTFAPLGTRAAGFSGNANFTALVAVFICASALRFNKSITHTSRICALPAALPTTAISLSLTNRLCARSGTWTHITVNLLLFCLTSLIIILTMSRSGAIHLASLYLFFCGYQMYFSMGKPIKTLFHLVMPPLTISVVTVCVLSLYADTSVLKENTRLNRLIHNKQVDDGSASSRYQAVVDSLSLIEQAPIFGHGTGFSRTMKELPHNLYLQQWINNGVFGLFFYVLFLVSAFITFTNRRYARGQALCIVAVTGSMFSHNVLDQRPFLILFGCALGLSLKYLPRPCIVLLPNEHHISQDGAPPAPHIACS